MPRIKHRSSSVKTWGDCPRAGWYAYVEGIRSPGGSAAEFGTRVHNFYEAYFTGKLSRGQLPTICQDGLRTGAYPKPKAPGLKVEHRFEFPYGRSIYTGTIDLLKGPVVWDHKTSGNPEKWAMGGTHAASEPLEDIQGAMYLFYCSMTTARGADVEGRWVVHHSKRKSWTPRVIKSVKVTRARAEEAFTRLVVIPAQRIEEMALDAKCAEDIPGDTSACGNYGGCPHAAYCKVDRTKDLLEEFDRGTDNGVGILNIGKSKPAAAQAVVPTPVVPPAESVPASEIVEEEATAEEATAEEEAVEEAVVTPIPAAAPAETVAKRAGKLSPTNSPRLSAAGKELLAALANGPMSLSSTKAGADDRRPHVHGKTLKIMEANSMIIIDPGTEDGFRNVRLPNQEPLAPGYVPAGPMVPPETAQISDEEQLRLSKELLENQAAGRVKAKALDLKSAGTAQVRTLLPALSAILDYGRSMGVDLMQMLEEDTDLEEK